jgi:uncharacterized protein YndB with AHSA1/START domain
VTGREIAITRIFDAPRELVWAAWTDPAQLAAWWGRRGWSTPPESVTMDVRPGGAFRLNSISEADGSEMPQEFAYREVVEPERLVFEQRGGAGPPGREATVTFTDLGDGRTEMIFETRIEASEELRDRAEAGLRSAFDRLAEQFAPRPQEHL